MILGSVFCKEEGKEEKEASKMLLKEEGEGIVFLGDSITEGGSKPTGYVSLVEFVFDINGFETWVKNAGVSGNTSRDMLVRLRKDVIDLKPTWVSISCGVNDVWHSFTKPNGGVPLEEYKKNMTEIVDRCLQAGLKVLLLTATPIMEKLDSPENIKLKDYNEFLRQLAAEKKTLLCDLNRAFTEEYAKKVKPDNLLTTDGVHMNPRGNRLMAREIAKTFGASPKQLQEAEKRWELTEEK